MSAKYTEFCEYKIFYSKISQYKVLSTKLQLEICKKCAKFHKLIADSISSLNMDIILKKHGTRSLPDFKSNPYQVLFQFPTPRIMNHFKSNPYSNLYFNQNYFQGQGIKIATLQGFDLKSGSDLETADCSPKGQIYF